MLSLDFTNTLDYRHSDNSTESLTSYERFLDWAVEKNITEQDAADKLKYSEREPEEALNRVLQLRELLYRLLSAAAMKKHVAEEDLDCFNSHLAEALGHTRITQTDGGFDWSCRPGGGGSEWIVYTIVKSAADLLVSNQLDRLRVCANPQCGWLFLDSSRNRSRRWCSMDSCGNRAKARRFYKRHQHNPDLLR
ncbi:MAG: CGNR zinc finger domain-containing protein [Spirochaetaceae bacterium]|nr:MAG: CGNR zinc finger domain-containing protein [Spirochaetaceae bacterium]